MNPNKNFLLISIMILLQLSLINSSKKINANSPLRKLDEYENYIRVFFQKELGDFYWENNRENEQKEINACLNNNDNSIENNNNCIVVIYQVSESENENYAIYKIVSNTWDINYEYFFSEIFKIHLEKLIYVDFSNSKNIKPKSTKSMFNGTYNIESIDFTNFDTSFVTDMSSMFENCTSLKYLDLSMFNTSLVSDMTSMFSGCNNLEYLDIDSFNTIKCENNNDMFNNVDKLKYLNLYNFIGNQKFFKESYLFEHNEELNVCQSDDSYYLLNKNAKCGYYNIISKQVEENNYIVVHFGKDVQYKYGFAFNNENEKNKYRNNISFIINADHNRKINVTEEILITAGNKIEIYFSSPLTSLESFFDINFDPNVEFITSIDFPSFNSSLLKNIKSFCFGCFSLKSIDLSFNTFLLENMNSMFKNCKSLEYIDFSYFDTSFVTDMSNMFYECISLKKLDLSFFNTTLVNNMSHMFEGCNSLSVVDISKFNMENINDVDSMFKNVNNLKYINIFNVENTFMNLTNSELKDLSNLIVCQQNNIIINKDVVNQCCYYDIEKNSCEATNYMVLYFSGNNFYEEGFASTIIKGDKNNFENPREKISFIIIGNNRLEKNEPFKEHSVTKMELYFSSPLVTLESFFDSQYFNVDNLISVDLSHFVSSSIKNMANFLKGCNHLLNIDFSFFNSTSLTRMSNMLNGCSALKSINLSSFNTPNLIDMNSLFYDCSSLDFIDISNFDMKNCNSFNNIFTNLYNIKYINIRNLQNHKNIFESLKLNKSLYICQKESIIENPFVINCCDYNFKNNECDFIPQTFNLDSSLVNDIIDSSIINDDNSKTSIIELSSDFALLDSKLSTQLNEDEEVTSNEITYNSDNEQTDKDTTEGINSETILIMTSYLNNITEQTEASVNDTTISTIKENITSISSLIKETVINTQKIQTTTKENINPYTPYIDPRDKEEANIIFLGISHYRDFGMFFYIYMYFTPLKGTLYSDVMDCPINVITRKNLRNLEDDYIDTILCIRQEEYSEVKNKVRYMCLGMTTQENAKQSVKMTPEFNFSPQTNINLVGMTPMGEEVLDNIMKAYSKYDYLLDSNIFIMNNAILSQVEQNLFDIKGIMLDSLPNFEKVIIPVKLENQTEIGIQCDILQETKDNYNLKCQTNNTFKIKLENLISFLDNQNILLIIFDKNSNSQEVQVEGVAEEISVGENISYKRKKDSGGLKSGVIVAIIISSVIGVAIITLIIIFCIRRKRKNTISVGQISTVSSLATSDLK